MAGRSSVNLVVALVSVVVMLGLALALIPPYGASGAGGAWAAAIVIQNALLYGYARWRLRLSAWTRELYRPLVMVSVFSCAPALVTRIVAGDQVGAAVVAGVLSVAGLGVVLARHEVTRPG